MRRSKCLYAIIFGVGLLAGVSSWGWGPPGLWKVYYKYIKGAKFVDLTHTFAENTPVWYGFGQAKFERARAPVDIPGYAKKGEVYTYDKHGFIAHIYTHVGQYGTHVDPPCHFKKGGMTLDKMPVEWMIAPLCVIDITPKLKKEPYHQCSVEDIKEWEKKYGKIPEGAFVALRTDWSKYWEEGNFDKFKSSPFPAWDPEAVKWLFTERKILAIGHETMDTDTTHNLEGETWLLHHDHFQVEVMTNLDKVPPVGAIIVVAWPKPKDGSGFPCRAFAICPK